MAFAASRRAAISIASGDGCLKGGFCGFIVVLLGGVAGLLVGFEHDGFGVDALRICHFQQCAHFGLDGVRSGIVPAGLQHVIREPIQRCRCRAERVKFIILRDFLLCSQVVLKLRISLCLRNALDAVRVVLRLGQALFDKGKRIIDRRAFAQVAVLNQHLRGLIHRQAPALTGEQSPVANARVAVHTHVCCSHAVQPTGCSDKRMGRDGLSACAGVGVAQSPGCALFCCQLRGRLFCQGVATGHRHHAHHGLQLLGVACCLAGLERLAAFA